MIHLAEARDGEDLFGEDGAGEQGAEFEGAEGDDGDQGVAQGVFQDHAGAGEAFGAGGADVVLVEHRDHGAAGVAHEDGGDGVAEDESGHDGGGERLPGVLGEGHVAGGRQPAEIDGNQ